MIAQGLPIYMALEPVDMRFGYERLGGLVREKMRAATLEGAVCVRGQGRVIDKILTWDGTGVVMLSKKLDAGKFELPRATRVGDQHVSTPMKTSLIPEETISSVQDSTS